MSKKEADIKDSPYNLTIRISKLSSFEPSLDKFHGGLKLLEQGNFVEAEAVFEHLKAKNPDEPAMYNIMAYISMIQRDFRQAYERYKIFQKRFPGNIDAYMGIGNALLEQGKFDEAEEFFMLVQTKFPNQSESYNRLAHLFAQKQQSAQINDHYPTIFEKKSNNFHTYLEHGNALFEQGKFDKAEAVFQRCIDKFPARIEGYERHAYVAYRKKQPELAMERYNLCLNKFPENFESYIGKCSALIMQGKFDEAYDVLLQCAEKRHFHAHMALMQKYKHFSMDEVYDTGANKADCKSYLFTNDPYTTVLCHYLKDYIRPEPWVDISYSDTKTKITWPLLLGQTRKKLKVVELENVYSSHGSHGLYSNEGKLIPESIFLSFMYRGRYCYRGNEYPPCMPSQITDVPYEAEPVLFLLTHRVSQYGHWMGEALVSAWYLLKNQWPGKIIFYGGKEHAPFQREILNLLDIDENNTIFTPQTTHYKNIIIPEQCKSIYCYSHHAYKDIFQTIARRVIERSSVEELSEKAKEALKYKKIYISRSRHVALSDGSLKLPQRFACGEKELENILSDNGFFIMHTHHYSETEKVHIFNNAQKIVINEGSAHFALGYSLHKPDIFVFGQPSAETLIFDSMMDYKTKYYFSAIKGPAYALEAATKVQLANVLKILKEENLIKTSYLVENLPQKQHAIDMEHQGIP